MANKVYVWKGPATSLDVWSEPHGPDVQLIFSGQVAPDREIPVPLPEEHSQVVGWLAFKLIAEKPAGARKPEKEKVDG